MRVDVLVVIAAMLLPFFAMKEENLVPFFYWFAVTALYLIYIAVRRWEIE